MDRQFFHGARLLFLSISLAKLANREDKTA
jgi:hypothetical protein